jgi:hypothetical protein
LDEPQNVVPPEGLVYSNAPRVAQSTAGPSYILKGPDLPVVVAEALGYSLAPLVGLTVPDWALCRVPSEAGIFFASRELPVRSGIEFLIGTDAVLNPDLVPACIAFDLWVANTDRNVGNIVAEPQSSRRGRGVVVLHAIDFEKAQVLRGTDRFTIGGMPLRRFCPTDALAALVVGLPKPLDFCKTVRALPPKQIDGLFEELVWAMDGAVIPWRDSAADQLVRRAERLEQYVEEAWI